MNRTDYRTLRTLIRGNGFAYVYRLNWELQPDGTQRFDPRAIRALEQLNAERDPLQTRANAVRYGANHRERVVLYCPRYIFAASRIGMRALAR